jgi:anti-anti-sigma factor
MTLLSRSAGSPAHPDPPARRPSGPPLVIKADAGPEGVTMVITGELDLTTRPVLAEHLSAVLCTRPPRLILDLAGTSFVDCGSARLIVRAGQFLPPGRRLVVRHPSRAVRRVLELTAFGTGCEIEGLPSFPLAQLCLPLGASMTVTLQDVRHALHELGRLRFGELRVEEAMHRIVETTHAIFSVDGAGLMLADADHHLRNAAVSDDQVRRLEELQIHHGEGPCITAFDDKVLVGADDLISDSRWPSFSQAAVDQGIRAVLASPIPYNQDAVGVVAVLSRERHPWSAEAELALLAFTDLAALLIASMMMGEEQTVLTAQLQSALNSRAVIEQAKGVLVGQRGLSPHAAYEQIRAQARAERRKIAVVAGELVTRAVRET